MAAAARDLPPSSLRRGDADRSEQEIEHSLRVVRAALVAVARVTVRHPRRDDDRATKGEPGVSRVERCHSAMAEPRTRADDSRPRGDDGSIPSEFSDPVREAPSERDCLGFTAVAGTRSDRSSQKSLFA